MKVAIDGIWTLKFDIPELPKVGQRIEFLETMDLIPAGDHVIKEIGECVTAEGTYPLIILEVELPWRHRTISQDFSSRDVTGGRDG